MGNMEGGYFITMVNYPDLSNLTNSSGVAGLMALPNSSYPYFWAWIMGGIWVIMVFTMFFKEKEKLGRTRILSSMAVASLSILLLSTIGTALTIITVDIMINILVFCMVVIAIWFFSSK